MTEKDANSTELPDFRELTIEHKELFRKYLSGYQPKISEFTFTNLFSWRLSKQYKIAEWKEHLIICYIEKGKKKMLQPIGEDPASIISELFKIYPTATFERVEREIAESHKESFVVEPDRDNSDYVYRTDVLRELAGERFGPKRNFIKQFKKYEDMHDIEIFNLDEEHIHQCLKLHEKWCDLRNCQADEGLKGEDMAIRETLANFSILDVKGIVVMIDGKVEAFALGEALNDNTIVDHFEKANTDFKGIYQFLLNEIAKKTPDKFEFINREQDLGAAGLRKSKESWYPDHLVEKYKIKSHN